MTPMIRKLFPLVLLAFLLPLGGSFAQSAPDTYWVQFTDKSATPYSIDQPEAFLSARAIQRRTQQGIAIDDLDLPVDPAYVQAVLALGDVQLHNKSKWLNAITIRTIDTDVLDALQELPFVLNVRNTRSLIDSDPVRNKFDAMEARGERDLDYGDSFGQIAMMNGQLLHAENSQGQGMLIGVLDSGFESVDEIAAFDALRSRGGIRATSDQVDHDGEVYQDHWHGRSVLSCMAAIVDGALIGTAPQADYVLVRTENADIEFLGEEDNWISGAEFCDSLGVDILNSSLGYTTFDDSLQSHTYDELDGATARISIAAGIAARKGMIPVLSAGNQGNSEWLHISAPADAIGVLSVGATGAQGQYAFFSSQGPSADGRVKPDVSAMGWGTTAIGPSARVIEPVNGTSFSSPLVAGLVACLWQRHPQRTAQDIMDAVRRSASQYDAPDSELGYGIPDFHAADLLLELTTAVSERETKGLVVFPMPFTTGFTVQLSTEQNAPLRLELFDMSGRSVWSRSVSSISSILQVQDQNLASLKTGSYLLRVEGYGQRAVLKLE